MATQGEFTESASPTLHRNEQVRTRRYEPTSLYALAEHLKREGVELHKVRGPWHPVRRPIRRPGRNAERAIPIVTNGQWRSPWTRPSTPPTCPGSSIRLASIT